MSSRAKGALLLILAFVLGAAAGVLGTRVFAFRSDWHTPEGRVRFQESILARMTKQLDLRSDQQQAVRGILQDAGQEFTKLREEMRPRFQEIRSRTQERIRGVLDGAQQAKFQAMVRDWEERGRRRHGSDGPAPGGAERKAP